MGKIYYDSTLTDAQIQQVLDAINNLLTPSNNGKAIAISGGTLEARSVQWGGGGGYPEPTGTILLTENGLHNVKDYAEANVQVQGGGDIEVIPLSVTANDTYTAPAGKAYSPVTVNVSGGGGDEPIIPSTYKRLEYVISSGGTSTASPKAGSYATNRGPKILNGQYIQIIATNDLFNKAYTTLLGISKSADGAAFECDIGSGKQNAYGSVAMTLDKKAWANANAASNYPLAALWQATADLRQDFYICAWRFISDSGADYPYNGRIYRIIIGDAFNVKIDGTVNITGKTLDFIPCKRLADDKVGLYDWINDEFYPSEGGTEFIAGPDF